MRHFPEKAGAIDDLQMWLQSLRLPLGPPPASAIFCRHRTWPTLTHSAAVGPALRAATSARGASAMYGREAPTRSSKGWGICIANNISTAPDMDRFQRKSRRKRSRSDARVARSTATTAPALSCNAPGPSTASQSQFQMCAQCAF